MKTNLKVGVVGVGARGYSLLPTILQVEGVAITAICDRYPDRREKAIGYLEQHGNTPFSTGDYKELVGLPDLDAVIVSSSWAGHVEIALDAMRAGKYVAVEVGGAYSVEECWSLVRAYRETSVPCMMLENCCYGRRELMVLNMVRQGIFGEVVHCEGGYRHDLRSEIAFGRENRHYRLANYMKRNCENYPTHELGPIAEILDINRGNRMLTLTSVASKSRGLNAFLQKEKGDGYDLSDYRFAQGDVVTTTIRCARGETIVLTLDTTLPHAYSRGFRVQGTKAQYMEDNDALFIDGVHNSQEFTWKKQWGNACEYEQQYDHPLWKNYFPDEHAGHDGMDYLVFCSFFDSVRKGTQTPIDVYDMAAWMCVSSLSEESVSMGGHPVAIPDFTNGEWMNRESSSGGAKSMCKSR